MSYLNEYTFKIPCIFINYHEFIIDYIIVHVCYVQHINNKAFIISKKANFIFISPH